TPIRRLRSFAQSVQPPGESRCSGTLLRDAGPGSVSSRLRGGSCPSLRTSLTSEPTAASLPPGETARRLVPKRWVRRTTAGGCGICNVHRCAVVHQDTNKRLRPQTVCTVVLSG